MSHVLVTGGAGYVGSALVPRLLADGHRVRVLDLCLYGEDVLQPHAALDLVIGDLRDSDLVRRAVTGCDAVIHLACISNDPSFELDPALGKSINFDAFDPLVEAAARAGVRRFVYASSSSVYGVSDSPDVEEDHPLRPLTDYSKFKAMCEPILLGRASPSFAPVVIRPSTVCGYAPRQRLDLTVNILTSHAVNKGRITVFGGAQMRPNIHIADMVDLYALLLALPEDRIRGKVWNAGWQNHSVAQIAEIVAEVVAKEIPARGAIEIVTTTSDDPRSYHVSSARIAREIGFEARRTVADASRDLVRAFQAGLLPDALTASRYFNVKRMQELGLT